MIKRRMMLSFISLILIVGLSVGDMRRSQANPVFLPLIIGVTFHALLGVATAIEMYDGAPAPAAAVGASALSVTIGNPADGGASEGSVRVPTTSSEASAAAVPAPSAPSTAASIMGHDSCSAFMANNGAATTYMGIPVTISRTMTGFNGFGNCIIDEKLIRISDGAIVFSSIYTQSPQPLEVAPAGYGNCNSGICTLQNPQAVTNDGKQDLTRTGQTLAMTPDDLKGAVNAVLSQNYVSNDSVDVSGISVSGQPRVVRTTALASGGSEVTQITQKTDGAGQTYLEKRTYTIDAGGTVTSASQTAVSGGLSVNSAGTGYVQGGSGSIYTPAAPGSSGGTSSGSSGFPSDYAKSGEAAAAANSLAASLTASSAAPGDLITPDASGYTDFGSTFSGLLGWQLPGHTSQCPTASFAAPWGASYAVESHCQLIQNHWSTLQAAMTVVWSIVALFIVLRA